MANYPQLDDCSGVWTLKEVHDAVAGGYWRNAGSRGIFSAGRDSPTDINIIDFVTIASSGNATDFGDQSTARRYLGGCSSFNRGVFAGGYPVQDVIDYITIASTGNAADFGNLTVARAGLAGISNSTRGVFVGGRAPPNSKNEIDYITIASTGNAIDFGDMIAVTTGNSAMSSPTRGIAAGGDTGSQTNVMQFIEIATTGNATDFGDLTDARRSAAGASSSTRGTIIGGKDNVTTIEFITMASQGNAIDYGDMISGTYGAGATSNSVKAIYGGGYSPDDGTRTNVIGQFQISTGGLATDFGDLTGARAVLVGVSDSHGGLNDGYQGTRIGPIPRGGGAGQRGLFAGGAPTISTIRKVTISTDGNTSNFGNLSVGRRQFAGGASNSIRGLFGGGYAPGYPNVIDYITFSHEGNAADFGDLSSGGEDGAGLGNDTRGVFAEGVNGGNTIVDTISFVTIASIGNITDFGNLSATRHSVSAVASTTRGVFGGGRAGASPNAILDIMEYITIASAGDVTDFGNLSQARAQVAPTSSSTRGVFAGGTTPNTSTAVNTIDFITIASTGNASDFGDLTQSRFGIMDSVVSNSITGIFGAGRAPGNVNTIDKITIASAGDASDFGDLNETTNNVCGASNGHGGLS